MGCNKLLAQSGCFYFILKTTPRPQFTFSFLLYVDLSFHKKQLFKLWIIWTEHEA